MKKIYLFAVASVFASATFAQSFQQETAVAKDSRVVNKSNSNNKVATDTLGWVNNTAWLPEEFALGGQVWNYGAGGGGYLYGNNQSTSEWNECGQGYLNLGPTTIGVEGVIMLFSGKDDQGTGTADMTVKIYNMALNAAYSHDGTQWNLDSEGPSGNPLATTPFNYASADTTFLAFNYAAFSSSVAITGDFAVSVDFAAIHAAGDTIGLISDTDGEGFNLAFHSPTSQLNQFYLSSSVWGGLNNNIALFPVIDAGVGVESENFYNNMQLSAYPNPVVDQTTISYNLNENMRNVTLIVYDMTGKKVHNVNYGNQPQGSYNVTIDATNFTSGNYFYSLIANGNRLTKRMVITK